MTKGQQPRQPTCISGCSMFTLTAGLRWSWAGVAVCPVMGWVLRCNAAAMLCNRFSCFTSSGAIPVTHHILRWVRWIHFTQQYQWCIQELERGGGHPTPSPPPLLLPFPSSLSFPPLRSRTPLIQLGRLGERCKLPQWGLARRHTAFSTNHLLCYAVLWILLHKTMDSTVEQPSSWSATSWHCLSTIQNGY